MSQLRFASFNEAIQHLSDVTGKKVRIAWRDQSKEIMEDVVAEIKGKPALMTRFKKYVDDTVEPGMKVRATNKGGLVTVDDVDTEMMTKLLDAITKAPKSEIFKVIEKDEKGFPKFHKKYSKGLQEQDGFWRGKPGLLQRGKDFLTKDKGEQSEEAEKEELELNDEKSRLLKDHVKNAKNKAKALPDSNAKDQFVDFFADPDNKARRSLFEKEFSDSIDEGKITSEIAKRYEEILTSFMKNIEKDLSKEMPGFTKLIEKMTAVIEKEVDESADTALMDVGGNRYKEETGAGKRSSEQMVDNIVDVWSSTLSFEK